MMLKNFWPVIAWSVLILILTGIPGAALPRVGNFWNWIGPDKMAHFFLYGIFFYLLIKSTAKHFSPRELNLFVFMLLLLIGIIFAALTEVLQSILFVNRNGNLYDFMANVVGCLAGLGIFLMRTKKKPIK